MPQTYTVREDTSDGAIVGTYTHDDLGAGPQRDEIIEVNGKRWRVLASAEGEETLLVHSADDFAGLDDVEMAARHADETRDMEQDEADNVAGPSGPHVEPEPDDRYS